MHTICRFFVQIAPMPAVAPPDGLTSNVDIVGADAHGGRGLVPQPTGVRVPAALLQPVGETQRRVVHHLRTQLALAIGR